MPSAPIISLDLVELERDPYPVYRRLQKQSPIAYVPELDSVMMVCREDVFAVEKMTEHLSVNQPDSMMTRLMGENMMRKDGVAHAAERTAIFPAVSPRTVKNLWLEQFKLIVVETLDAIVPCGTCEVMEDFSKPIASRALCVITGLTNMDWREMDRVYLRVFVVDLKCPDTGRIIDCGVLEAAHLLAAFPFKGQELDVYLDVVSWNLLLIALGVQFPHARASGQSIEAVASENAIYASIGNFDPMIARQIPNDPDGPQVILAA